MKPKNLENTQKQDDLFKPRFELFINMRHPLVQLSKKMDWDYFDKELGVSFVENVGRPGLPTRLMVGLTYLKYLNDLSDEDVVSMFLENNYWQYFCGYEFFQTEFPCDSSSMTRFRKKIGENGAEKLFKNTLHLAHELGFLKSKECKRVIVDTTVQEKNITFPTDAKLYFKMREKLVSMAEEKNIPLRQSYARVDKLLLLKQAKYAHAKQYKRARKAIKKLRTHLGRVIRDIERKVEVADADQKLRELIGLANRLFYQQKTDKNKIYSIHEPDVSCIAKGKAHKPYEFGCKVGIITTARKNWVLGVHTMTGNPFDGKTLKESIKTAEINTGVNVTDAFVDKGYRGKEHHPEHVDVHISGKKRIKGVLKKLLKRRSAIEPLIGHMKHDHRMERNRLKGKLGDALNALFAASAFNLRKVMREVVFYVQNLLKKMDLKLSLQIQFI